MKRWPKNRRSVSADPFRIEIAGFSYTAAESRDPQKKRKENLEGSPDSPEAQAREQASSSGPERNDRRWRQVDLPADQWERRLDWIYRSQQWGSIEPYARWAAILRAKGEDANACEVLYHGHRLSASRKHRLLLGWIGYGYRRARALLWFAVLVLVTTGIVGTQANFLYSDDGDEGVSVTASEDMKTSEFEEGNWANLLARDLMTSLDIVVPVVEIQAFTGWEVDIEAAPPWLPVVLGILSFLGLLLVLVVFASFSRVVRQEPNFSMDIP